MAATGAWRCTPETGECRGAAVAAMRSSYRGRGGVSGQSGMVAILGGFLARGCAA